MKKVRILCIGVIITGISLFLLAPRVMASSSSVFEWCIGLASALIVLGLGYFINSFLEFTEAGNGKHRKSYPRDTNHIGFKEKAGYLVCKIMSILLCIYLLLLNQLNADPIVQFLSIALILIQYILDLTLQIFYARRKGQ